MRTNPMIKPQTSSGWAVTLTVICFVCLVTALRMFVAQPNTLAIGWALVAIATVTAGAAVTIWFVKIRRANTWIKNAVRRWEHFLEVKSQLVVSTEITIVEVQSTDPLGGWVTIRWERFGHIQRAWVEALPDEIWRHSVLLITPDPDQIQVHGPWPEIYYLMAIDYHAFAAAQALPYITDPKYQSLIHANPSKS